MSYFTPSEIANQFVAAYFQHLHKEPETLHQFYSNESCFSRVKSGEKCSDDNNVFGLVKIQERIAGHGYQNCKVAIDTIDAQPSCDKGVIVMVTGIILQDGGPRDFTQTFFLQEDTLSARYFIRNDVLRYLKPYGEDEVQHFVPEPVAAKNEAPEVAPQAAEPVIQVQQQAERKPRRTTKTKPVQAAAPVEEPVAQEEVKAEEVAAPVEEPVVAQEEEKPIEVAKEEAPAAVASPPAAAPAAEPAPKKKAWNDIPQPTRAPIESAGTNGASSGAVPAKGSTRHAIPTGPIVPERALPHNWATICFRDKMLSAAPAPAAQPAAQANSQPPRKRLAGDDDTVLFVSNLPSGATESDVAAAFNASGEVPTVQLAGDKPFCFVQFQSAETVNAILSSEKSIVVKGVEVTVDRRKRSAPRPGVRQPRPNGARSDRARPPRGNGDLASPTEKTEKENWSEVKKPRQRNSKKQSAAAPAEQSEEKQADNAGGEDGDYKVVTRRVRPPKSAQRGGGAGRGRRAEAPAAAAN